MGTVVVDFSQSVDVLELSCRAANALFYMEIKTIGDLVQRTRRDLLKVKNFGRVSLREIEEALADRGCRLRTAEEDRVLKAPAAMSIAAEPQSHPSRFPQAAPHYFLEVYDAADGPHDHNVTAGLEVSLAGDIGIRVEAPSAGNATLYIPKGSPLYVELRETLVGPELVK